MRCRACDKKLTNFERLKKDKLTKVHLDMCSHCQIMSKPEVIDGMKDYENIMDTLLDRGYKI